jgi:hypothetical protein
MKKRSLITITIVVAILILSIILINKPASATVSKSTAICVGENAKLYTQFGCHACETQEQMFGENYQYLSVVDCFYNIEKCESITHTPTWVIDEEKYIGVQDIEKLKELTGCS